MWWDLFVHRQGQPDDSEGEEVVKQSTCRVNFRCGKCDYGKHRMVRISV